MKNKNLIYIACAAIVVTYSTAVRLYFLDKHFGSWDDIGVASTILSCRDPKFVNDLVDEKLAQVESMAAGNTRIRVLGFMRDRQVLNKLRQPLILTFRYLSVPILWTYAPLQYFMTDLLLKVPEAYRSILFWGRFPSCLAGIACLLVICLLFRSLDKNNWHLPALAGMAVIGTSMEHIIFSMHMSSYAAGVLALLSMILLLAYNLNRPSTRIKRSITNALFLLLLLLLNYQTFMFIPAFLLTIGIHMLKSKYASWQRAFSSLFITAVIYTVCFAPVFYFRFMDVNTVLWNAGPSQEFLFRPELYAGITAKFLYSLNFLARNSMITFAAMLSPAHEGSAAYYIYVPALGCMALYGLVCLIRDRISTKRSMALFFIVSAFTWLAFILSKRLPLCPTRHSLILIAIFAMLIAEGIYKLFKEPKLQSVYTCCFAILAVSLSAFAYPRFTIERQDLFSEETLQYIHEKYNAKTFVGFYADHILLMPRVTDNKICLFLNGKRYTYAFEPDYNTIAFISTLALPPHIPFPASEQSSLPDNKSGLTPDELLYSEDFDLKTDVEFTRKVDSASNGIHIRVIRKTPTSG